MMMSRRILLAGGGSLLLAGCQQTTPSASRPEPEPLRPARLLVPDTVEPFPVEPVDLAAIPAQFHRQVVPDPTGAAPGTIVVDTRDRYVFLVRDDGTALRYGCGIGRDGFAWSGEAIIRRKAVWPRWTPPREMIEREPDLEKYAGGMPGGPDNPLGARALYLYQGNKDTLYRLHGTSEPGSIGQAVSSGCVRLLTADIIDLHRRVPVGTRVLVKPTDAA